MSREKWKRKREYEETGIKKRKGKWQGKRMRKEGVRRKKEEKEKRDRKDKEYKEGI